MHNLDDIMVDLWAMGRGFIGERDDPHKRIAKPILYVRGKPVSCVPLLSNEPQCTFLCCFSACIVSFVVAWYTCIFVFLPPLVDNTDDLAYGYARPIEGLTPVIDLGAQEIIEIEDLGTKTSPPRIRACTSKRMPAQTHNTLTHKHTHRDMYTV